jgi:hypothetical protein
MLERNFGPNLYEAAARRACLSFRDVEKAHRVLDEFAYGSGLYYDLSSEALSQKPFYPILLFAEALVYQADVEIEAGQRGYVPFTDEKPWLDRRALLLSVLEELGVDDRGVTEESSNLARYWQLENQVLQRMRAGTLTHELVMRAMDLRASDVMMLHHMLHRFLDVPRDAATFRALLAWEVMLEIDWDLDEYADEVATNDYNTYRMFVNLYGEEAPARIAAERARREAVFHERVAELPIQQQTVFRSLQPNLHARRPRPDTPAPILEDWASLRPIGGATA